MRRPMRDTIRSMTRRSASSEVNFVSVTVELPCTLNVDLVETIDHDLRDGRVIQEPLNRPVPQDVVRDFADQALPLQRREGNLFLLKDHLELVLDRLMEFCLLDRGVSDPAAKPLEECLTGAFLEGVECFAGNGRCLLDLDGVGLQFGCLLGLQDPAKGCRRWPGTGKRLAPPVLCPGMGRARPLRAIAGVGL